MTGLPGPDVLKCQIANQNMPNFFNKCWTNRNRLMAISFALPD